jgi:hypothetical protein
LDTVGRVDADVCERHAASLAARAEV